jgi:hypothetical protein
MALVIFLIAVGLGLLYWIGSEIRTLRKTIEDLVYRAWEDGKFAKERVLRDMPSYVQDEARKRLSR